MSPMRKTTTPAASPASNAVGVGRPWINSSATAPPAMTPATAAVAIVFPIGFVGAADASFTASIGDTLQARHAGSSAATTVATVPISTAHPSARHDSSGPATGIGLPSPLSAASMARPISSPSGAPISDATSASSVASINDAPRSCRGFAPTSRSDANVRRRSAYSRASEFATVTMPTRSASPANPINRLRTSEKLRFSPS